MNHREGWSLGSTGDEKSHGRQLPFREQGDWFARPKSSSRREIRPWVDKAAKELGFLL
jgi:hypothetical protein